MAGDPRARLLHRHRHLIQLEIHTSKPRLGRTVVPMQQNGFRDRLDRGVIYGGTTSHCMQYKYIVINTL